MVSLKTLLALKPNVLYPAHGAHVPTPEKASAHITEYITHRQEREDQILSLLREAGSKGTLATKIRDHRAKMAEKKAADIKYKAEFNSGKPYKPKTKKPEEEEAAKKAEEEVEEKVRLFEDQQGVTVSTMCRLIYGSDDEKLIFAAGKSVLAHLIKLEGEKKVERFNFRVPKIINEEIGEAEEQEVWMIATGDASTE